MLNSEALLSSALGHTSCGDMHFITFGTHGLYNHFARQLAHSAICVAGFETAIVYDQSHFEAAFKTSHQAVLALPRGFGAWSWKSFCILRRLDELDEGDILAYCDSLYIFKRDIRQTTRGWLENRDIVLFKNKPSEPSFVEKHWAKYDAFQLLGGDLDAHGETPQVWAGFVMLRKTPETVRFIRDWYDKCADIRLMSDAPSVLGEERPDFVDTRHDQQILSISSKVKEIGYPFEEFPADLLFNIRVGK